MFHKRLMKEFKENQKYVAGMVAAQWGSLLCNVALMYAIGVFLEKLLLGTKRWRGRYREAVYCLCGSLYRTCSVYRHRKPVVFCCLDAGEKKAARACL